MRRSSSSDWAIDNILILDREDDLGGTWHVNHYPGLAVDIPSTTYSYWFEPNPHWSRLYAPGAELKAYAEHVADKYDVRRHMRFNAAVDGARWDEEARHWQVGAGDGETLTSRFLITATGYLSQPRKPDIPGIEDFAGRVIHTHGLGRRLLARGERLGRHRHRRDRGPAHPGARPRRPPSSPCTSAPRSASCPRSTSPIPTCQRSCFARVPLLQRAFGVHHRHQPRSDDDPVGAELQALPPAQRLALRDLSQAHRFVVDPRQGTARQADAGLRLRLQAPDVSRTPTTARWPSRTCTCRPRASSASRPTASSRATARRPRSTPWCCATGFDIWEANIPAIEIIGRDARNLGKWWRDNGFQAYQGVTIPAFPNFLSLAGPYASSGLSYFNTMEYQMRHMDRLFGELRRRNVDHVRGDRASANTEFRERMSAKLGKTVFRRGDCARSRSYYFSPSGETLVRPAFDQRDQPRERQLRAHRLHLRLNAQFRRCNAQAVAAMCKHGKMLVRRLLGAFGAAVLAPAALLMTAAGMPSAAADPCPDIEVIFARGTGADPGLGFVGDALVNSLRSKVGGRSVEAYAVNYPAGYDFDSSAPAGAADAPAGCSGWPTTARTPSWCSAACRRARA